MKILGYFWGPESNWRLS